MAWKNLSTWLKFGIVFAIINVAVFLFYLIAITNMPNANAVPGGAAQGLAWIPYTISTYPTILILMKILPFKGSVAELFLLLISGIINWFLIGSLIGYVVGKIKSKQ
jgi:hypothetical protein